MTKRNNMGRYIPKLSVNLARKKLDIFFRHVSSFAEENAQILVIGCGTRKTWMDRKYSFYKNIKLIYYVSEIAMLVYHVDAVTYSHAIRDLVDAHTGKIVKRWPLIYEEGPAIGSGENLLEEWVEEIHIYEFDKNRQLRVTIHAESAKYDNGKWLLHNILKTEISRDEIINHSYENAEWEALLNPEVINLVTIKPRYLSLYSLVNYIKHLKLNNQDNRIYMQALWLKLLNPLMILIMMLLAICVVKCDAKPVGLGQRVFLGVLFGITFHLANQMTRHLGIVYNIPIFISVAFPSILVFLYINYSLSRDY